MLINEITKKRILLFVHDMQNFSQKLLTKEL